MKITYPSLNYKYSFVYDKQWSIALHRLFDAQKNEEQHKVFINKLRDELTENNEARIMQSISKYTGLAWRQDSISIYFVNNLNLKTVGFSDPLTIKINDDIDSVCETIIHELVHVILTSNHDTSEKVVRHLSKVFPHDEKTTTLHIIVNAVTKRVFTEVFGFEKAQLIEEKQKSYHGLKRINEIIKIIYPDLGENILESLSQMPIQLT